jgi:hypothetical protein
MTISVDFDRTFAADPRLWGEFARQSAAAGNRVVMVSRRPDTPENQDHIAQTLGDYREAFDAVLLVGDRLKDEAAREAGIAVDVWVDDSPQFVRATETRAAPYVEGDWVTLPDGRVGRVDHVMTEGELNLGDVAMPATPDAPVALVSVWEGESFGEPVPVAVSELQAAEEPEAARAYGKPKRKPRRRKRG